MGDSKVLSRWMQSKLEEGNLTNKACLMGQLNYECGTHYYPPIMTKKNSPHSNSLAQKNTLLEK